MKLSKFVLRFFFSLIVISLLVNAAFFVVFGIFKCYKVYAALLSGQVGHPAVDILATADIFFLGIVQLILAVGIAKLFMPDSLLATMLDLPWINITNLSQLKLILWETLMLAMVIFFIVELVENINNLTYSILFIPVSIVLLTVSLFLLKKNDH